MTAINTKVIFYNSIFEPNDHSVEQLSDLIEIIKSTSLAKAIAKIRNSEYATAKKLKQKLPAFQPALTKDADNFCANGIIAFDIDKKDNDTINFEQLKEEIKSITTCLYAFTSPSGGLKFGIQTDFADTDTDEARLKARYKKAYKLTLKYVCDKTSIDFIDDGSSDSVKLKCHLSHDINAYINLNCEVHNINAQCAYVPFIPQIPSIAQHDNNSISELLRLIPRDFSYDQRLPVNCAVLNCLGSDGIPLLLQHWDKQEKDELKDQLEQQAKHLKFGSIGLLVNIAAKNENFKNITGWSRLKIEPKPSDIKLEELLSPAEGSAQLVKIVRSFFDNDHDVFVNVTTGAGKSKTVLDVLAQEIPYNKKVLILVPSHKLANELETKFKEARNNPIANEIEENHRKKKSNLSRGELAMFIRMKTKEPISGITHLLGRDKLCDLDWEMEKFGGSIPWQFCSGCPMSDGCRYIDQFQNRFDNIRLMTHSEWINQQSAWFSGRHEKHGDIFPNKKGSWKPDYIIIDENIFNVDLKNKFEDSGEKYSSIKKIIRSVESGQSLADAIIDHKADVFDDSIDNVKPSYPQFKSDIDEYMSEVNSRNRKLSSYSEILARLESYCIVSDPTSLNGMWVYAGKLFLAPIIRAADRYKNIPTLFLDATANEQVVRAFLPNIEFHSIKIRAKDDIHLYQLANSMVTKFRLKEVENRLKLIEWIRSIIDGKDYKTVGLITYIDKFDGLDCNFDEYLANQLKVKIYSHFGAVRGIDIFDDVDCLLIVGRNYIGEDATRDLASAIFHEVHEYTSGYAYMPVRMKDGTAKLLNCLIPTAPYHDIIHEHFSQSETKQAIGRARTVHGNAKDVYLFSNESLGLDIEVTDFFRREFKKPMCSDDAISNIREIGFVANKPKALVRIGLSDEDVRSRRASIILELADADIHLMICTMCDSSNRANDHEYFVADTSKFVSGAKIDDKTFVAFA